MAIWNKALAYLENRGFTRAAANVTLVFGIILVFAVLVGVCNLIVAKDAPPIPRDTVNQAAGGGLGVTRSEIQQFFDYVVWDPAFETDDGEPALSGASADGKETVFLVGPEEGLTQIGYITKIDTDPNVNGLHNVKRWSLLLSVFPNWQGAADWMSENTPYEPTDGPVSTVVDGATVDLRRSQNPSGHMILSIRK